MPIPSFETIYVDVPSVDVANHRTNTFRTLLDHIVSPRKTLVDLGAGPCIFSKIARDRGYAVTAVDARTARVPSPQELGSIRFVQSDVRSFGLDGYDIVLILGVLYHLSLDDQRTLLSRAAAAPVVIVETEVHIPELIASTPIPAWQAETITVDGYQGVVFPESDNPMAAVGNPRSFWHTEQSMLKLLADSGFHHIKVIDPPFQSKYGGRRFYLLAEDQSLRFC